MPVDITVQIVNFRTRSYLEPCLRSLRDALAGGRLRHEVVVLENGSGEDLSDLAADDVTIVESAENLGFGGGHNLLAARGGGPLVCLLNPDVVVDDRAVFPGLVAWFEDPAVVATGPRLVEPSGATQRWDHGERDGLRARVANGAGNAHWRERDAPADAAWVSGAFLVVRRTALDAVGGFDERFFLYKEEEDLCLQLWRRGGRVVYDPRFSAAHVGGVVARRETHMDASVAAFRAKNLRPRAWPAADFLYRHVTRRI